MACNSLERQLVEARSTKKGYEDSKKAYIKLLHFVAAGSFVRVTITIMLSYDRP
jgi:hypothetical protein